MRLHQCVGPQMSEARITSGRAFRTPRKTVIKQNRQAETPIAMVPTTLSVDRGPWFDSLGHSPMDPYIDRGGEANAHVATWVASNVRHAPSAREQQVRANGRVGGADLRFPG